MKKMRIASKKRFFTSISIMISLIVCLVLLIPNKPKEIVLVNEDTSTITVNKEIKKEINAEVKSKIKEQKEKKEEPEIKLEDLKPSSSPRKKVTASRGSTNNSKVNKTGINIKPEEIYLLEQLVHAEAKGESLQGKIAVANVVVNRVKSNKFPNTIRGVILQKNQFSPVSDGSINTKPSKESIKAVQTILEGYKSFNNEVVFFCNTSTASNQWIQNNKKVAMNIGNHTFYFE